jgi:DNA-binding LytR/AlgR family response regulator
MPKTIRILAIEDEPIYAESLRLVIEELGYILIDVVGNINEFQRLVKASIPDILLIDIDLGQEIDGIQLADLVSEETNAPIIFITASRDLETINRSKQAHPSAYIPKPYEASALQAAIELAIQPNDHEQTKSSALKEAFFVKSNGVLKKVNVKDVLFIEVKEKFCYIKTVKENMEVRMRLKDLIDQLPKNQVFQIHRSFAVMKDWIDEVDTGLTTLKVQGTSLPVGKNYKEGLGQLLKRI